MLTFPLKQLETNDFKTFLPVIVVEILRIDETEQNKAFKAFERLNQNQSRADQLSIGPVKPKNQRKVAIIFLSIRLNMYFGCSNEPSHRDGSFEYPQHTFWLRNRKNIFQLRTLIWRPGCHQMW